MTEGAEVGTFVLQVSANDLDLGLNGKVSAQYRVLYKSLSHCVTLCSCRFIFNSVSFLLCRVRECSPDSHASSFHV